MKEKDVVVNSTYITLRDGRKIYAKDYGIKVFRFEVTPDKKK